MPSKKAKTYLSTKRKTTEEVLSYSETENGLFRYLAYRDIGEILTKYANGKTSLDYGCGTGISSSFLKSLGLTVQGVDVSEEMLIIAKKNNHDIEFRKAGKNTLPYPDCFFDIIFSSFVLFEMGSKTAILKYLQEAKRVLKQNGVFILLTGSDHMYTGEWSVMETNFPENKNLKSGGLARISLPEFNVEFTDYYWTEQDYVNCIQQANFELLEALHPKGKNNEPYKWKDELEKSPFCLYVLKHKSL